MALCPAHAWLLLEFSRIDERQGGADRAGGCHALDLGRGPVGHDPPVCDEHDAVGEGVGLLEVMGGEDHRPALRSEARTAAQKSYLPSTSRPTVGSSSTMRSGLLTRLSPNRTRWV